MSSTQFRGFMPDGSLPTEARAHVDAQVDVRVQEQVPGLVDGYVEEAAAPHIAAATTQADRSTTEANRAQGIADTVQEISGLTGEDEAVAQLLAQSSATRTAAITTTGAANYARPSRPSPAWMNMMQPGHGFTALGTGLASANLDDTSRHWRGNQCATITSLSSGTANMTIRGSAPIETLNLLDHSLRIGLKINRPDLVSQLNIRIGIGYGDVYVWRPIISGQIPDAPFELLLPASAIISREGALPSSSDGSLATTTGFNTIAIQVIPVGTRSDPIILSVQSLEMVRTPAADYFPTGCVSVTFDDNWESVFTRGKPVMDRYGIRSTQYVIAQSVGQASRMTLPQLRQMHNEGHEIGLHAYGTAMHSGVNANGFEDATEADARRDLSLGRNWLLGNGFPADSFAYPKGKAKLTTDGVSLQEILPAYFPTARSVAANTESTPPGNPAFLWAITGVGELGGVSVKPDAIGAPGGLLERVRRRAGWQILLFHDITPSTPSTSEGCSVAGFEQICAAIQASGVEVLPVREAMARIVKGSA